MSKSHDVNISTRSALDSTTLRLDFFEKIPEQEWDMILTKLTFYTHKLIFKVYKWANGKERLPQGLEAHDIVYAAITLTMTGQRSWKPEKCDLITHLRGVVKSSISNLARSKSHHNIEYSPTMDQYESPKKNTLNKLIKEEKIALIINKFKDDATTTVIAKGLIEGRKRREIMKDYNIRNTTYDYSRKKIRQEIERLNDEDKE